jgi:hypothetical protein
VDRCRCVLARALSSEPIDAARVIERLFVTAAALLAVAAMLHQAWELLRPALLPVAGLTLLLNLLIWIWRRRTYW